jgi:hypothetical protein
MAKMSITFDGFEKLAEDIDEVGGDLHAAVDEALAETQKLVQDNLTSASAIYGRKGGGKKGYATGEMYRTIIQDLQIDWRGTIAEVKTGFSGEGANLSGFMHSIFVMYGTPRMPKNAKVYNAIKGTQTRKQIAEKQEEIMVKHLELGKGR